MGIVLIGMKSSGKTTVGDLLAKRLNVEFVDMDSEIENQYFAQAGTALSFREIFKTHGKAYFRGLETAALRALISTINLRHFVLATGGGLPLIEENRTLIKQLGTIVFLDVAESALLPRIVKGGVPAFFPYPDDLERSLNELLEKRRPVYEATAHVTICCEDESPEDLVEMIARELEMIALSGGKPR